MPEEKIGVIGIRIQDGSVGPEGNHLRWSFPPALGFPRDGFEIYRRVGGTKPQDGLSFTSLSLNTPLAADLRINGVALTAKPSGRQLRCQSVGVNRVLTISPGTQAQLELHFPNPIVHLRIEVSGNQPNTLRVYNDHLLLAQTSSGAQVREIYCANITRATIDLGANQLRSIAFTTEASTLNADDWELAQKLPLPVDQSDALKRLENNLKNYYAANVAAARVRYETGAAEIVLWLKRLITPEAEYFEDPTVAPHQLRLLSKEKEVPSTAIYLQSVFLLAALDPNIARMMALYWVDAFKPDAPGLIAPPKNELFYDYRVDGLWKGIESPLGLLMHVGPPAAPLPHIKPELAGEQLRGIAWRNQQPVGRVGLRWSQPILTGSPQDRAVAPVLYDLARTFRDKTERIPEPILVDSESWKQSSSPVVYVDRDLQLGEYTYELRPIDLFGQVGEALKSNLIKVVDNEAPPPPIRTRSLLTQSDSAAQLRLQFEFGAFQHQQAPDVARFNLYWRADSLIDRHTVRASVVSITGEPGNFVHTVRITNPNNTPISMTPFNTLIGDVLTNVSSGADEPLPANQRRRFRIASVVLPDRAVLEPTTSVISNGVFELVRDPHNRASWTRLNKEVAWRNPVQGTLTQTRQAFSATVSGFELVVPLANPFSFLPPSMRGRHFPSLPPVEEILEVEIDRLLTEPDILAGGTAEIGADTFEVRYVVSSLATRKTRIGVAAHATVAVGDTLELRPPLESSARIRSLRTSGAVDAARIGMPGGELVFERVVNDQSITEILRVISDAKNVSGAFEVLVLAEDAQAIQALRTGQTQLRYYAPFVVTFPVSLANGATLSLPIATDAGVRDGFVAVTATDVRDNEGPLSTSSQFTVTRPRPSGAPDRPYPCGMDVTAAAGYATPPSRSGRATICLAWEPGDLNPVEGVRYEVARALDSAITAAHLRDWQLGKANVTIESPVISGPRASGMIEGVRVENGMLRALFTPLPSGVTAETFRHGRIEIESRYFQVTLAKVAGDAIALVLRGPTEPLPGSGLATIEAPPNYDQAFVTDAALQSLALQVPDAFALVTGVPINQNQFTDDVVGVGRSRFFYRVRAVDAAENRSEWSQISAPFHQVDTTPPRALAVTQILSGERQITLRWQPDRLDTVNRYEIHRSTRRGDLELPATLLTTATISIDAESLPAGDIQFVDQVAGLRADEAYLYNITAIKRVRIGLEADAFLEIRSFPSPNVVARPLDSSPALPPTWSVTEWWNLQTNASADATTEDPVVRLVWATAQPQTRCSLYRRRLGETIWRQIAASLVSSGTNAEGEFEYLLLDPDASPSEDHEYQVEVQNRLNRKNDQFVPVLLRRLR